MTLGIGFSIKFKAYAGFYCSKTQYRSQKAGYRFRFTQPRISNLTDQILVIVGGTHAFGFLIQLFEHRVHQCRQDGHRTFITQGGHAV